MNSSLRHDGTKSDSRSQLACGTGAVDKLLRDRGGIDIAAHVGVQHIVAAIQLPCTSMHSS